MYTYIASIIGIFLIFLVFRGKKTFTNAFTTGLFCTIGAILVCSTVNIIRLDDLKTEIVKAESHELEFYKINPDTTYILRDTLWCKKDSIESFEVHTKTFKKLADIDTNLIKKMEVKVDWFNTKVLLDTANNISVKYKNGDNEINQINLSSDDVIVFNTTGKYSLSLHKECYIGDNWTSHIGLPAKDEFYVLSVPMTDSLISDDVCAKYKKAKNNENYIAKYNL